MTPETAEQWLALRRRQSQVDRATAVLHWAHTGSQIRMEQLRQRNPGASDAELLALWTEETYRGTVNADFLARVCAAIREGKRPAQRA
jgi:hypothetical protein